MTPGASLDRRAEVRLSVCENAALLLGRAKVRAPAELLDLSPCGFRVFCHLQSPALPPLLWLEYRSETAQVRPVWWQHSRHGTEAGLLREEVFLIHRLRAGQGESLLALVTPYMRSVRGVLRTILRNREDSEDVLQECLLKILARIHQFHPGNSFRAWLLQIATNEALKHIRDNSKHRHPLLIDEQADEDPALAGYSDPRQSPLADLERKEFQSALAQAIESLDDIYRQTFVMRDLQQMEMAEIAVRLGISMETANTRLHRARVRLRKLLGRGFGPAGTGA